MHTFWCWLFGHKFEFLRVKTDTLGKAETQEFVAVCQRCGTTVEIDAG
jgi:hypothetical protein